MRDHPERAPSYAAQAIADGEWAGWSAWIGDPFEDIAGPFYFRPDPEYGVRCAFRAEPRHMNGSGFMHGGVLMTFADSCVFTLARQAVTGRPGVTASFESQFVGKVQVGDLVECTGEVVKAGRSLVFIRGVIAVGDAPALTFSAIIKLMRPGQGALL